MADSSSTSGKRRQRAPTITINTSAVSIDSSIPEEEEIKSFPTHSTTYNERLSSESFDKGSNSPINLKSQPSQASGLESRLPQAPRGRDRDSRSSLSQKNASQSAIKGDGVSGFLAVPSSRSRQNSIETNEGNQKPISQNDETYFNSSRNNGDCGKILSNDEVMNDPNALDPDLGTEAEFQTDPAPFAFSQGQLNKLINPKSLSAFYALGGLAGLEKGLRTDRKLGISVDETNFKGSISFNEAIATAANPPTNAESRSPNLHMTSKDSNSSTKDSIRSEKNLYFDRRRVYKDNRLPVKEGKSLLRLMWITYNDKVLILLSIAAAVSLAVGLYQTFGTKHSAENPPIEWVEGVAIIAAILIVVFVGSLNDWQKERQFVKLNSKKQDRNVNVIRSGKAREISVFDVLVGDIMHLEPGDMIPVDGIFIDGHNVKCDESQITGESDIIRKYPADEVYAAISNHDNIRKLDPFILSGGMVCEGVGTFVVTSTGVNSSYGKTLMSLREDPEVTPLQSKLNTLAEYIAKLGGGAGLLLFTVLFIEFLARLPSNNATATEKGQQFLQIFIVTVTIIVVAVPEGLPLAVTLALAFATTRMLKDNNLVRHLKACEVMGNATAICSDKTGTLTQNKLQIVAGTFGKSLEFKCFRESHDTKATDGDCKQTKSGLDRIVSPEEFISSLHPSIKQILTQSITANTTAFEGQVEGVISFIGSKTETAMLTFARDYMGMGSIDRERSYVKVLQLIPFDSGRKLMGVVVQLDDGNCRLYVKGAPEIILQKCSVSLDDATKEPNFFDMTDNMSQEILNQINDYASQSLRTIAFAYRDFEKWPPKAASFVDGSRTEVAFTDIFEKMTLLGFFGIQDPLRDGVALAVKRCQDAGVIVRMVTGDNMMTAKAIAEECGILTGDGLVMEGPEFRRLKKPEMLKIIPNLQVLARSSPEDKRILVKRLKDLGETVAVTGDGTNDAPALKIADVGFSMGISGTEVAKEASAIILMDDNFSSIVKAMMWGRAVNDAVKKFLQFQVTVNITAVILTFITAIANNKEESVLTAVQLLWVNLIMDTMAALALATDPPTESVLDRKSEPKSAPLITTTMWKMIIGETIYQLIVTLALNFGASSIFSYKSASQHEQIPTLVFNTFVWMQIFNQWNNRRLDNKFNIFEGISKNYFFIGINIIMIAGQIMIIFVGGKAFNVRRLDGAQWAYSLILGFLSIPLGAIIRLIPDEFIARIIPDFFHSRSKGPRLAISDEEEHFRFSDPLTEVKEELYFLKLVKGGRLNNLKFAIQDKRDQWLTRSRSGSRSRNNSAPQTPNPDSQNDNNSTFAQATPESRRRTRSNRSRSNSALGATTVMAGIIAGSVAGWSPIDRAFNDNESIRYPQNPELEAETKKYTQTETD
ncbi:Calcium-transporting ATPase 2 [Golovinomyces cichoracearum]|uniref:Calcium-transporting ATPase n=1 Tax=Golovinomyces cichoracearum TaxID=62708 RepID=A0A420IP00_9PEZI|nr:Calcium-transporting ATPase 2 [Golovinomyces cichoracearum]